MMLLEKEAGLSDWKKAFRELKNANNERISDCTTKIAENSKNFGLNRYNDVLAYDHSRVIVHYEDEEIYINANYVIVTKAKREYILTQGPLEKTVDDFWLMVYQQNSSIIVMLCNCFEMLREKSCQYWPSQKGHTKVLGGTRTNIGLEVSLDDVEDKGHYIIRSLSLKHLKTGDIKQVKQYHYVEWPDFNIPKNSELFLDFLLVVRESGCFLNSCGPPIVHCSAGIGRSGSLILVDSCLVLASYGELVDMKEVVNVLLEMRTYRKGLIQTEDQLQFSVKTIIQGIKRLTFDGKLEKND